MNEQRKRPRSLDRIDEHRAEAAHFARSDYHLAAKFRRMMIRWAGVNELRWKALAILHLREVNGWSMEMIGLVFGHPKGHVTRIVRDIKADMTGAFMREFANHKSDSYCAVRTIHAEVILECFEKAEQILTFVMQNPDELREAISELREQLMKWKETH